jgi:hypothetical protein
MAPVRRLPMCQNVLRQNAPEENVNSEKDRAAQDVIDAKADFEMALSNKRRYPVDEPRTFVRAVRRYIGLTAGDTLIHRNVAGEISGLADYLKLERKRVPGNVLVEADRLHCLLFSGYDPYFEGDEPPGL